MTRKSALVFSLSAMALLCGQTRFSFRESEPGSLALLEDGRTVFVYNYGLMRRAGVPEDRFRSSYIHPLNSPAGIPVTGDFPKDHYHHRGISWMWPHVRVGNETADLWLLRGVRQEFVRWLRWEAGNGSATLGVENGWFMKGRQVLAEQVEITARATEGDRQVLDFVLRFEPASDPVEIGGETADKKGYGGLCVRFAPRENTVITTSSGTEKDDTNMAPHGWAQLEGVYSSGKAALRIDIDDSNPGFPNGWCLRHYGFLGVNFPGLERHTLTRGTTLVLRYRITVADLR